MASEFAWDVALECASHQWDVEINIRAGCLEKPKRPTELSELPPRRSRSAASLRPRSATEWRKSPSTLTMGGRTMTVGGVVLEANPILYMKRSPSTVHPSRQLIRPGAIAPMKAAALLIDNAEGLERDGKIDQDIILRPAMRRCKEENLERQRYRTASLVGMGSELAFTRMRRFNGIGLAYGCEDAAALQVSPDLTTDYKFAHSALMAHNELRAKHGAPPLRWSEILAGRARLYADDVVKGEHQFLPSDFNLCRRTGGTAIDSAFNAVAGWYAGGSSFDARDKQLTPEAFAYALILWRSTTHVGMNLDESGRVVTAVYYPPANLEGPFAANVLPPLDKPLKAAVAAPQAEPAKTASLLTTMAATDRRVCQLTDHNGSALSFPAPKKLPEYPPISWEDLKKLKGWD